MVTTRAAIARVLTIPREVPDIICQNLLWIRDQGSMALHAFVLMPDHLHLIVTPCSGRTLAQIMHTVKGFSAQRVNSRLGTTGAMWQVGYHEQGIRGREALHAAIQYVEQNPLEANLVDRAEQWSYSSASENYRDSMDSW